ncbi:DUF4188 domain-containing protein, partial [Bacillus altitudinis]|nr:DUF4188 domain-containing protein [Bacillus altitudinis]
GLSQAKAPILIGKGKGKETAKERLSTTNS